MTEKEIAEAVKGLNEKEIAEKAKANLEKMNIKDLPETIKKSMIEGLQVNLAKMMTQDLPETLRVRIVMEINDKNERIEREFDIMGKRFEIIELNEDELVLRSLVGLNSFYSDSIILYSQMKFSAF